MTLPSTKIVTNLSVNILDVVLFIDIRARQIVFDAKSGVPHLNRQTVLQIEQASLADVLHTRTRLADFRFLVAHTRPRTPSEHCERPGADFAFFAVTFFALELELKK